MRQVERVVRRLHNRQVNRRVAQRDPGLDLRVLRRQRREIDRILRAHILGQAGIIAVANLRAKQRIDQRPKTVEHRQNEHAKDDIQHARDDIRFCSVFFAFHKRSITQSRALCNRNE